MLFWIICTLLTLIICGLVFAPLLRSAPEAANTDTGDVALYHAQIAQVDADVANGLLDPDEAEARRAEIARRLITSQAATPSSSAGRTGVNRAAAGAASAALIAGAIAGYMYLGAPGYPDLPLQKRMADAAERRDTRPSQIDMVAQLPPAPTPTASAEYQAMVARLREVVTENPDDLRGLSLLAQHEASLGNYDAAITAQTRYIELKADEVTPADHLMMLDLLVYQARGYVSPEAEAIARTVLDTDPANSGARYYIALMHDQTDRPDIAFRLWRDVIDQSPAGDPYAELALRFIAQAAMRAGEEYTPPEAPRGPTSDDIAAAQGMSSEDQAAMIRGMVDGLASRLAEAGGPPEDWARLIAALGVLGETDRATAIWQEARTTFAGDTAAVERVDAAARRAGLQ